MIDPGGSRVVDARESYWHTATGGVLHPDDLHRGERLLVDAGLAVEEGGSLGLSSTGNTLLEGTLNDALSALLSLVGARTWTSNPTASAQVTPDEELVRSLLPSAVLLEALRAKFDDEYQRQLGAAGETVVVRAARQELLDLDLPDLARAVRQVSLESDILGYDVWAPRMSGSPRLLEVKSTSPASASERQIAIHLSRNEADVASRERDWALVICAVDGVVIPR